MNSLKCLYCKRSIQDDNYLHCDKCNGDVHIRCLRHNGTPGDLLGDVFFDFTCADCHRAQLSTVESKRELNITLTPEKFVRQHLPWVIVISLAIYNLSIKSKGLSNRGYFHWRTHIVSFIEKNWSYIFDPAIKKRKNWIGSISGTLSHNSPAYFTSGQEVIHEAGWWRLTHTNKTPKLIYDLYKEQTSKRQQGRVEKRSSNDDDQVDHLDNKRIKYTQSIEVDDNESDITMTEGCSRLIPYMGRPPKIKLTANGIKNKSNIGLACKSAPISADASTSAISMPLNTVQSNLMDFLAENLAGDDLNMLDSLPSTVPDLLIDTPSKADILPPLLHENDVSNLLESNHLNGDLLTEASLLNDTPSDINMTESSKSPFVLKCKSETTENFPVITAAASTNRYQDCFQSGDCSKANLIDADNHTNFNRKSSGNSSHNSSVERRINSNDDNFLSTIDIDNKSFQPRIVKVINFQQINEKHNKPVFKVENDAENSQIQNAVENSERNIHIESIGDAIGQRHTVEEEDVATSSSSKDMAEDSNQLSEILANLKSSLFKRCSQRPWPWLTENSSDNYEADIKCTGETIDERTNESSEFKELTMMSKYEEKELLQKLKKVMSLENECQLHIPSVIRRFYRKLCIREWRREHGKPIFNLDAFCNRCKFPNCQSTDEQTQIIDRFQLIASSNHISKKSFYARIAGVSDYERFQSPYTKRILHPFIYRNSKTVPAFLQVMCELKYKTNGIPPTRGHIDYCYVRPNHIAAVNALLQTLFWPGIDMSECLSYPDYSIVALYKKLVIGCGFLVPDVGFNEAYISFMAVRPGWQRSGIATFMLYHLIQTCMTKDITLHVSATNPAVVLYQKFGFKIEEVILNFYDKYLPLDSKHSRNALFLRLIR